MQENLAILIEKMEAIDVSDALHLLKMRTSFKIVLAATVDPVFVYEDCSGFKSAFRERALALGVSKKEFDTVLGKDDK